MFHFGLPSQPLNFEIGITNTRTTRFNKLMYIGSGSDALPLPLSKTAVYVDNRGNTDHEGSQATDRRPSDKAELILTELIEQAKDIFSILEEPLIEWDMIEGKHVANVLFTWGEMPILTHKGDSTKLIYLFGTDDTEMGSNNKVLKQFSDSVDIIWWCGFDPDMRSFTHIDFSKVVLALGWNQISIPDIITKHCHRFYYIQYLRWAYAVLKFYPNDPGFASQYPKAFDFGDLCRLLGCLFADDPFQHFTDWERQNDLYELNSPFYYMRYCIVDDIYKLDIDPTLVER